MKRKKAQMKIDLTMMAICVGVMVMIVFSKPLGLLIIIASTLIECIVLEPERRRKKYEKEIEDMEANEYIDNMYGDSDGELEEDEYEEQE